MPVHKLSCRACDWPFTEVYGGHPANADAKKYKIWQKTGICPTGHRTSESPPLKVLAQIAFCRQMIFYPFPFGLWRSHWYVYRVLCVKVYALSFFKSVEERHRFSERITQEWKVQHSCNKGGMSQNLCAFVFLPSHDGEQYLSDVALGNLLPRFEVKTGFILSIIGKIKNVCTSHRTYNVRSLQTGSASWWLK